MSPRVALAAALLLAGRLAGAVEIRSPPGALHGFPSMSDASGAVIADGELTQERRGAALLVHARWRFRDGREARESDVFHVARELVQERFEWVETRDGDEERRFEVDFASGKARSVVRRDGKPDTKEAHLDLPPGRAFAGYGTALAASELPLDRDGAKERITFVAFTPAPRAVTLEIRRDGEERIPAAGRSLAADRFTLHPVLPFPLRVIVHPPDAHLWFTRAAPRALLRAEQNLVAKDDPRVTIDVIPRGPSHAPPSARRPAPRADTGAPRR